MQPNEERQDVHESVCSGEAMYHAYAVTLTRSKCLPRYDVSQLPTWSHLVMQDSHSPPELLFGPGEAHARLEDSQGNVRLAVV